MAHPREAAKPPPSTWRNHVDIQSEPRGPRVLEEAVQGGCAPLASVLKELTLRMLACLFIGHRVRPKE